MNHEEQLLKIRKRTADALKIGMLDESHHGIYQATLIQLLNECEKGRQSQQSAVENLKRQIAVAEGQMHAYSMMGSIVFNVLDSLVRGTEKTAKEIAERQAEHEKLTQEAAERERHIRSMTSPAPAPSPEEPDGSLLMRCEEPSDLATRPVPEATSEPAPESVPEATSEPEPEPPPPPPSTPPTRRGVVRRPKLS
jgi:hypothetical protein